MSSSMNSLKVPDSGLLLESSAGKDAGLPSQAFALSLSDNVIEDMIKCVQNGDGIQLALGGNPTLLYGSNSHVIAPPNDSRHFDLYLTQPFESTRRADRVPYASTLFEKPKGNVSAAKIEADKDVDAKSRANKGSTPSGLDSDIEALQNGMTAIAASREKARMVDKLPTTKKSAVKAKGKLLSGYNSTPRSIPASPGPTTLGSPLNTPVLSATEQHVEKAKEQRVTLVHELAVQDRSRDYLAKKWSGKNDDLEPTLRKVADYLDDTKKWTMKKGKWKELDVWSYDYENQATRQTAIDNAVRQYDRQRVSPTEPEWERLLPREERGTGKCLSKLQANLAKGPAQPAPKIKVQNVDGGATPRDEVESLDGDRPKASEAMSRSASNPLPTKGKKLGGQSAQVKRLLGNSKAKTVSAKTSPTKGRVGAVKNTGRVLSQEIIENSDSSGDEVPLAVKPKPVVKDKVVAKPRPVVKAPIRQQVTAKRAREDDDSSSSSGTPLSKRIKPRQPLPAPRLKHRPSDASQNSRGTVTSASVKSKNTSPTKSSPLASSPPTNASDLEHDAPAALPKKRKLAESSRTTLPPNKRVASTNFSDDLVQRAQDFKEYYSRYEALHNEISGLDHPSSKKLGHLKYMRERLQSWKKEIYSKCAS